MHSFINNSAKYPTPLYPMHDPSYPNSPRQGYQRPMLEPASARRSQKAIIYIEMLPPNLAFPVPIQNVVV